MFTIFVNGVGDAFSTRHWGTSFLLSRESYLLAVDCPDSYLRALTGHGFAHPSEPGESIAPQHLDALWLTHLHGDHVNGLEMLLAYRKFIAGGRLELHSSEEVVDVLWDRRLSVSLGQMYNGEDFEHFEASDYLDLRSHAWGSEAIIGPFTIQTRRTRHHIPTTAMRISDGEHTLSYSCDTAFDPELIDWLQPADVIVHETSFGPAHTPLDKLAGLDEELRRKLWLVHCPDPLHDAEAPQSMGLQLLEQGAHYRIDDQGLTII